MMPFHIMKMFQHVAARRRLVQIQCFCDDTVLFQHAAARRRLANTDTANLQFRSFNTQPPEGGWFSL